MNEILEKIYNIGIVPVVALEDVSKAVDLGKALCDGGLPLAEVTFRTEGAPEIIKQMRQNLPQMIVGAGTVLTKTQADEAINAGAQFIVTPGFSPDLTKYIISKNMLIIPGTATVGEMQQAMELGLDIVKFFPAEQNGGLAKLKAISAPLSKLKFMPTGGINLQNMNDYLNFNKIIAVGGSWMVKAELIKNNNFAEITRLAQDAVKNMLGFELAHLGINTENAEQATKLANQLALMFNFCIDENPASIFSGNFEIMKSPGRGKNGHIAIATNNVQRAISFLSQKGFRFDETSIIKNGDKIKVIYFAEEFAGFAIHLVQKI